MLFLYVRSFAEICTSSIKPKVFSKTMIKKTCLTVNWMTSCVKFVYPSILWLLCETTKSSNKVVNFHFRFLKVFYFSQTTFVKLKINHTDNKDARCLKWERSDQWITKWVEILYLAILCSVMLLYSIFDNSNKHVRAKYIDTQIK